MAHILVVDDEAEVRQLIQDLLTREGHELIFAENGRQALERARNRPLDLVITDLIMPEMEGLETIRGLRREHKNLKIIAISGGGRTDPNDYLRTARVFGACKTLQKPFMVAEFLGTVKDVLAS